MNDTVLTIIAILVVVIGLMVLLYFLLKLERKNNVKTINEAMIEWKEIKCVNCHRLMDKGYAFAGKGINWVPKGEKKPGAFSTVGSVLENTFSLRIPPAINRAWYCKRCRIVVFDNSEMLKVKSA